MRFDFSKVRIGPYMIYKGTGGPERNMLRDLSQAWPRKDYYNVFAVIKGYIDCEGPEGYGTQRFEEGKADTELPDYTHPGKYIFHPGPDGVEFFCISRFDNKGIPLRKIVDIKNKKLYIVEQGHIVALFKGSILIDGVKVTAPAIVDGWDREKKFTASSNVRIIDLWDADATEN